MSSAKTNARKCAVQALYQWQMTGESLSRIEMNFLEEERLKGAQKNYFKEIFYGVPKQLNVIDEALAELGEEYFTEEEIRLVRIKFFSELAN